MSVVARQLYRIGERLRGWNVLERLAQLHDMERWPADRLAAWQLERVQALLLHTNANVPFYRELWDAAGVRPSQVSSLSDLAVFPKTTKAQLVAAGEQTLDQSQPRSSFVQGRSSGSTGERFVYYKTTEHQSWWMAAIFLGWTWAGWDLGKRWVRLQFRGPLTWRARFEDWLFRCYYMPIDRFDDAFLAQATERVARFRPTLLRGYAGGTYVFAKYLLDHGDERIRPQAVCCTGDTLYPHYREAIEAAFDAPVFDSYGGEGILATNQCEAGTYHIMPNVLLEVESEGPGTDEGQPGRVLLTSLTNMAMPLIRYDIGDVAISGEGKCTCGRSWPHVKTIVGRETDIIVTPAGRRLVCHHFNNVLREFDGIDQFQVLQDRPEHLVIRVSTNHSFARTSDEPRLRRELEGLAGEGVTWEVAYVDDLPIPPSGKRRYIISTVP
jgi:phenylacetate-CoA ligase